MRILIAVPACRRLDYGLWESTKSPLFDPKHAYLNKGYGEDIHFSGENNRVLVIRETWGRDITPEIDLRFFYGSGPIDGSEQADCVLLNCCDDYAHLPHKVIEICRWAVENEYNYMLKCDDDTYVWVDRLLEEIRNKQWDYAGYCANVNSVSGGPGYWLSNRAMKLVAEAKPDTWAEDKVVEAIMSHNHIRPVSLPLHRCGAPAHFVDINNLPSDAVTAHAVKPEDMRELYRRDHP